VVTNPLPDQADVVIRTADESSSAAATNGRALPDVPADETNL
jgi:hypothetical protein